MERVMSIPPCRKITENRVRNKRYRTSYFQSEHIHSAILAQDLGFVGVLFREIQDFFGVEVARARFQ
jgi:hypothetical protein